MGVLNFFKGKTQGRAELPSGAFTVDSVGEIISSTVPSRFPPDILQEISAAVRQTFSDAAKAELPLTVVTLRFGAITIKAWEMNGGALVFLSPRREARNSLQGT